MSEQAGRDGADEGAGGHKIADADPWMSTVVTVSGFLAGFSLATVVVISDAPEHFRWPGVAALALTIASVVLVGAAQLSRKGAYYSGPEYRPHRRNVVWVMYHGGAVALLAGLGAALVPLEGKAGQAGVAGQQGLRWAAAWVAFAAAFGEVVFALRTLVKRLQGRKGRLNANYDKLAGLLGGRGKWHPGKHGRVRFWWSGADDWAWLVIVPEADGFLVYRADEDQICAVLWGDLLEELCLEQDEVRYARPAARRVKCQEALKQARRQQRRTRRACRARRIRNLWQFSPDPGG